jgi:hypothetical protein
MSRDRRSNRDGYEDNRDARRAAKHADKKHGRSEFKHNIKDVLASGDYEEYDELYEDDERHNRR